MLFQQKNRVRAPYGFRQAVATTESAGTCASPNINASRRKSRCRSAWPVASTVYTENKLFA